MHEVGEERRFVASSSPFHKQLCCSFFAFSVGRVLYESAARVRASFCWRERDVGPVASTRIPTATSCTTTSNIGVVAAEDRNELVRAVVVCNKSTISKLP